MKFKKEDLEDLFYNLIEAGEQYDNALNNISFEKDNVDLIFPLDFLLFSLPDDFELDVPDKVADWYKNKPQGVCLVDVLNKEGFKYTKPIPATPTLSGEDAQAVVDEATTAPTDEAVAKNDKLWKRFKLVFKSKSK